tara:strand:+ start:915 stop:1928 length:1014 start_codon:yes stop_codon:yes gene_type:complete
MTVRYYGDEFKNLNFWDQISLDNVIQRYVNTIKSFDAYEEKNGQCFIYLGPDELKVPGVVELHEKYNSPYYDYKNNADDKICMYPWGRSPFGIYPEDFLMNHNPNIQMRDGMVRSGLGSLPFTDYFFYRDRNLLSDKFIYIEIPKEIINKYMVMTTNKVSITIARDFVDEVESTIGWEDLESIKPIIKKYDNKYPHWNHDFPIFAYSKIKLFGLIFPIIRLSPFNLIAAGSHRLIMTALSGNDIPFLIPIPFDTTSNKKSRTLLNNWAIPSTEPFFKDDTELWINIDIYNKKLGFYLSEYTRVIPDALMHDVKQKGWTEPIFDAFNRAKKELIYEST